jgi:hypothetical protein
MGLEKIHIYSNTIWKKSIKSSLRHSVRIHRQDEVLGVKRLVTQEASQLVGFSRQPINMVPRCPVKRGGGRKGTDPESSLKTLSVNALQKKIWAPLIKAVKSAADLASVSTREVSSVLFADQLLTKSATQLC